MKNVKNMAGNKINTVDIYKSGKQLKLYGSARRVMEHRWLQKNTLVVFPKKIKTRIEQN